MLVLLAVYVVAVKCDTYLENKLAEKAGLQNETGVLVESLRRRLMKNNYDYETYETSESEDSPVLRQHGDGNVNKPVEKIGNYDFSKEARHNEHVNNLFVPRAHDDVNEVSKKDLLYYMDDDKLGNVKSGANNKVIEDLDIGADATKSPTTHKVKYKVFKMRNKSPNRRSGNIYQRFIKEEGADGIALIPIDDGPLPQFRLPHYRRQYMHDHNGFSVDEFDSYESMGTNNEP